MYWFPLFYKIFTGFVVKVCQLDVLSKKLPSHDRLTTNEGVEPTHATRIKIVGLSAIILFFLSKKLPSHDRLTTDKGVEPLTANKNLNYSEPLQAHRDRFI